MRYGICTGPEHILQAAALGYDYVELSVTGIMALEEAEFLKVQEDLNAAGLRAEAFNVLFPGTFRMIEGTPEEEIRTYLQEAMRRVHALGGRTVVFGSGAARKAPEGWPYGKAFLRLIERTRLIGEEAAKQDITVAIEPLRYGETNMVNTLSEGAALEAMTGLPNVRLLADLYHVWSNGEPVSQVKVIGSFAHIHISSVDRGVPVMEELPRYREFADILRQTGYDGRISVEGRIGDFAKEAAAAREVLGLL